MKYTEYAPLAQLDRVFGYEPKGRGFESLTACQEKEQVIRLALFLSNPKDWYIIDARSAAYIISPTGCISSRVSVHLPFGLMIYNTTCW